MDENIRVVNECGGNIATLLQMMAEAVSEECSDVFLDEVDDDLQSKMELEPAFVVNVCEALLPLYKEYDRDFGVALTLGTFFCALALEGQSATKAIKALSDARHHIVQHGFRATGLSLVHNVDILSSAEIFGNDELIFVLSEIVAIQLHFGEFTDAIANQCKAATLFSQAGAPQSAYRLLNQAEHVARENGLAVDYARTLRTLALVGMEEGDTEFALNCANAAIDVLRNAGEPIPISDELNLSVILIHKHNYADASSILQRLVVEAAHEPSVLSAVATNLIICRRELGSAADALSAIDLARQLSGASDSPELVIELELVACSTLIKLTMLDDAAACLLSAVYALHDFLADFGRVHYRRGIRARYVARIRTLISKIDPVGQSSRILPVIAFLKSSTACEWLHLRAWCAATMANTSFPESLRQNLEIAVSRIENHGPALHYGYFEKYDDPFEFTDVPPNSSLAQMDKSVLWRSLNLSIRDFINSGLTVSPYASLLPQQVAHLVSKTDSGCCILSVFQNLADCALIGIIEDEYRIFTLPDKIFDELGRSLIRLQHNFVSPAEFRNLLPSGADALGPVISQVVAWMEAKNSRELIVLPDQFAMSLPVLPALLLNDRAREKMTSGHLVVHSCPVISPKAGEDSDLESFIGIHSANSGLKLDQEEIALAIDLLKPKNCKVLEISDSDRLSTASLGSSVLHVAAHGEPISKFTDPYFTFTGTLGLQQAINLAAIVTPSGQQDWQLVVLNACHSSVPAERNANTGFRTNEFVGYPTAILLNGHANVVASAWASYDVVDYVFTFYFYTEIARGLSPLQSFARTVATMWNSTTGDVVKILSKIINVEVRDQKIAKFSPNNEYPLRHPYCYSASLYSLL